MTESVRVLVVEDSEDDSTLLVRELSRGGFDVDHQRVDTPTSMTVALENGKWDLVICDYSMPGFSGLEALKLLRTTDSEVPFIFLSGTLGEDIAVEALKKGAQDYVTKSNMKRLLPAIRRELKEAAQRRERRALEQQLSQLRRFEAIGRLAGGIAHDFNNALTVISGWAQLGYEEVPEDSPSRRRFQAIREQVTSSAGLIRQLLAFARQQVLQAHNMDLNALVRQTQKLLQSVLGDGIEFAVDLWPDLPPINADSTQIEQVLMNLCLNARDAMPDGGRIAVETRTVEISDQMLHLHANSKPGRFVLLSVSDTGIGMDPATVDRIFEPFFTTKEMGRGTGLGLATVYGIVKQHEGFINVYSTPGQGTSFHAYFPSRSGRPEVLLAPVMSQTLSGTETILVAEDHSALREMVQTTLRSQGYHVLVAENGEQAVRLFKDNWKQIRLVVLDVDMPALSGTQAYRRMCEIAPNTPVVFTTGYSVQLVALNSNVPEGATFLPKPYEFQALHQAVRSALDGADRLAEKGRTSTNGPASTVKS
jgi:two-component system cell cycle sensor histidine kinase/response regulator CckA